MNNRFTVETRNCHSVISNDKYSIKMIKVSRENIDKVPKEEWLQAGFYILLGRKSKHEQYSAYVGKTDNNFSSRLKSHNKNKDFWNTAIFVTRSNNGGFNPTDVAFYEYYLSDLLETNPHIEKDNIQKVSRPNGVTTGEEKEKLELLTPVFAFLKEVLEYDLEHGQTPTITPIIRTASTPARQISSTPTPAAEPSRRKEIILPGAQLIQELLAKELLKVGETLYSTERGYPGEATILENGKLLYNGVEYNSPSEAGKACMRSVKPEISGPNGRIFWEVRRPGEDTKNLNQLLAEYLELVRLE